MALSLGILKIDFGAVILSEASAGFADAESKDPCSPNPAPAARRLSGDPFSQGLSIAGA